MIRRTLATQKYNKKHGPCGVLNRTAIGTCCTQTISIHNPLACVINLACFWQLVVSTKTSYMACAQWVCVKEILTASSCRYTHRAVGCLIQVACVASDFSCHWVACVSLGWNTEGVTICPKIVRGAPYTIRCREG